MKVKFAPRINEAGKAGSYGCWQIAQKLTPHTSYLLGRKPRHDVKTGRAQYKLLERCPHRPRTFGSTPHHYRAYENPHAYNNVRFIKTIAYYT